MRRHVFFAALWTPFLIVGLALSACQSAAPASAPTGKAGDTTQTSAQNSSKQGAPYKLGEVSTITGAFASGGVPERDEMQLAAEQINAKGGVLGPDGQQHKLQLIVYDSQSDETKTVLAVKKLIEDDKVHIVAGLTATGPSLAAIPVVEKAKIPMVASAGSMQIVQPLKKWVFKVSGSEDFTIMTAIRYWKQHNTTKIATLFETSAFGQSGKKAFTRLAGENGITVVNDQSFGPTDVDLTGQLVNIKSSDAQAVLAYGAGPVISQLVKGYRQLGIQMPLCEMGSFQDSSVISATGAAANGVLVPAVPLMIYQDLPDSNPAKQLITEHIKVYKAKYGVDPQMNGVSAYDAVMMIAKAMETAGDDPAKLRDALEKTDYVGMSGTYKMSSTDHYGLQPQDLMSQVVDGKYKLLK